MKIRREVRKKLILICCVCVCVLLTTAAANATILGHVDIENHNNNNNLSEQAQLWGGGLSGGTYYTGVYSWTNAGSDTPLAADVPNWGFCIELTQGPYSGWQNLVTLEDAPLPAQYGTPMEDKANSIRELWGRFFNTIGSDRKMAEAFGACLWEIIYETDKTTGGAPIWDVTSGTGFHATGIDDSATANSWLSQLDGNTAYFANNLYATSYSDGQDFLAQVPEPATICMLALGAMVFAGRKK